MKLKSSVFFLFLVLGAQHIFAQQERWQMRIAYQMDIDMDVQTHRFTGKQRVILYNQSNEALDKVFYHLYYNAFQPNSMMDVNSRTISDPDPRVSTRISKLRPDEIGYQMVHSLKHNGKDVKFHIDETILEVYPEKPIAAGSVDTFDMVFEAQVPLQVRRTGRNSSEGIDYSMSQWYPKVCNFDEQGWHANPYVGREFYGIWGDFDVKINIDDKYIIGGTGYLQNPNEIGFGYEDIGAKVNYNKPNKKNTWHFIAPNVHDFVWGADPDYKHDIVDLNDSVKIHFFYQENEEIWKKSQDYMVRAFKLIQNLYGAYPFKQYSFIQGGDGGMEYPMATLITGNRNLGSLVGVMVHELMHNWYQMVLGSNESLYYWMDEGFTSYASNIVMAHLFNTNKATMHMPSYKGYFMLAESGAEEPMSTHADHFVSNFAYSQAAYSKGAVFVHQLEYIIGKEALDKGMLAYYDTWKFKHPNPNDFIRVMEKVSGLELDWYKEYFVNTTKTIDYAIKEVVTHESTNEVKVLLERIGKMPMPIEVLVTYNPKGDEIREELFYIPLDLTHGNKANEKLFGEKRTILPVWRWTHPNYELALPAHIKNIQKITIDPSERMADLKRGNNIYIPAKK